MSVAAGSTDSELLERFNRGAEGAALAALSRRYVDFVYAAALRQCGDEAMAADVTQAVFLVLARRSNSVRAAALPAWLHRVTNYVVKNAQRAERRRRKHERAAAAERREVVMPVDGSALIAPLLDRAIAALPSNDQAIIIERYLCGHSIADMAERLGVSVDATQKRLERAIARLRRYFGRHGIVLSAGAIPWPPLQSAPVGLGARLAVNSASIQSKSLAGKVIMQFFWAKAVVISGAVGLAIMPLVVLAQSIKGGSVQGRSVASTPPAAPSSAPDDGAPTLNLGDGTEVSVLGVFALGDTDRVWGADGKSTGQNVHWFPSGTNIPRTAADGGRLDNMGIILRLTDRAKQVRSLNVASVSGGAVAGGVVYADANVNKSDDAGSSLQVAIISTVPGQTSVDFRLQLIADEFTPLRIPALSGGAAGSGLLMSDGPYEAYALSKPFLYEGTVAVMLFSAASSEEERLVVWNQDHQTVGRTVDGAVVGGMAQRTEVFDGFDDPETLPPIRIETRKRSEVQIRNVSLSRAPTTVEMSVIDPNREQMVARFQPAVPPNEVYLGGTGVARTGVYSLTTGPRTFSELVEAAGFTGNPEDAVQVVRQDREHGETFWFSTVSALRADPDGEGRLEAGEQIIIRAAEK